MPLPNQIELCPKARAAYDKICDFLPPNLDEDPTTIDLDTAYNAAMKASVATKCEACLMMAYCSKDSLDELRSKVRAEVILLRQAGMTESEALHPLIAARTKAALAGRATAPALGSRKGLPKVT